jgi:sRNA-binding regulator protein Hfq
MERRMAKAKTKAPDTTFKEAEYLRELIARRQPVRVTLEDQTVHEGQVEYFDQGFIRLTTTAGPNLFIYKHEIKYLAELS